MRRTEHALETRYLSPLASRLSPLSSCLSALSSRLSALASFFFLLGSRLSPWIPPHWGGYFPCEPRLELDPEAEPWECPAPPCACWPSKSWLPTMWLAYKRGYRSQKSQVVGYNATQVNQKQTFKAAEAQPTQATNGGAWPAPCARGGAGLLPAWITHLPDASWTIGMVGGRGRCGGSAWY